MFLGIHRIFRIIVLRREFLSRMADATIIFTHWHESNTYRHNFHDYENSIHYEALADASVRIECASSR